MLTLVLELSEKLAVATSDYYKILSYSILYFYSSCLNLESVFKIRFLYFYHIGGVSTINTSISISFHNLTEITTLSPCSIILVLHFSF